MYMDNCRYTSENKYNICSTLSVAFLLFALAQYFDCIGNHVHQQISNNQHNRSYITKITCTKNKISTRILYSTTKYYKISNV